jgi:hypothetical protein
MPYCAAFAPAALMRHAWVKNGRFFQLSALSVGQTSGREAVAAGCQQQTDMRER